MALKSKPLNQVREDVPVFKEEAVRVNLNVPKSVRVAWKIAAAQRHTDLSSLIVEAMNTYLHTGVSK